MAKWLCVTKTYYREKLYYPGEWIKQDEKPEPNAKVERWVAAEKAVEIVEGEDERKAIIETLISAGRQVSDKTTLKQAKVLLKEFNSSTKK